MCVCVVGGFPTRYELRYRRSNEGPENDVVCTVEDLTKTLVNLDPQAEYVVRLSASNTVGSSGSSSGVTFMTFGQLTHHTLTTSYNPDTYTLILLFLAHVFWGMVSEGWV